MSYHQYRLPDFRVLTACGLASYRTLGCGLNCGVSHIAPAAAPLTDSYTIQDKMLHLIEHPFHRGKTERDISAYSRQKPGTQLLEGQSEWDNIIL